MPVDDWSVGHRPHSAHANPQGTANPGNSHDMIASDIFVALREIAFPMSMDSLDNPLLRDSPPAWVELIEAVSPAALLVVIEARMSAALKARHSPEDILQEALLHT